MGIPKVVQNRPKLGVAADGCCDAERGLPLALRLSEGLGLSFGTPGTNYCCAYAAKGSALRLQSQ